MKKGKSKKMTQKQLHDFINQKLKHYLKQKIINSKHLMKLIYSLANITYRNIPNKKQQELNSILKTHVYNQRTNDYLPLIEAYKYEPIIILDKESGKTTKGHDMLPWLQNDITIMNFYFQRYYSERT